MSLEEQMRQYLIPYCIELGWIQFDEETERNRNITANSKVIDWKILPIEQNSAVKYLKIGFPDEDEEIIKKVVKNNLKQ